MLSSFHPWRRALLPGGDVVAPKRRRTFVSALSVALCVALLVGSALQTSYANGICGEMYEMVWKFYRGIYTFDWKGNVLFHVTHAMKVSIVLSMGLGMVLGFVVGLVSGLEVSVLVGVSASMALGCVFVMSFAILHGVNVMRAVAFALLVSVCLPVGFGFGFGMGVLGGVFWGLEEGEQVREKGGELIKYAGELIAVVRAFTMEIL